MKLSDRGSLFITVGVIAVVLLAAVLAVPFAQRRQLAEDLARSVRMYRIGYTSHIVVAEYTQFEWDLLYLFPPYSAESEVSAALGAPLPGFRWTSIEESDSVTLLVFVRGERAVRWVELPRSQADFSDLFAGSPYPPEDALFFFPSEDSPLLRQLRP